LGHAVSAGRPGQMRHHGDGEAVPDQARGGRVVDRLESYVGVESGPRARSGQRRPASSPARRALGAARRWGTRPHAGCAAGPRTRARPARRHAPRPGAVRHGRGAPCPAWSAARRARRAAEAHTAARSPGAQCAETPRARCSRAPRPRRRRTPGADSGWTTPGTPTPWPRSSQPRSATFRPSK
jgi:hypothetical protein